LCFGLVIGSFLNVLILRLHSGESIASGRSKCPHCGHILSWRDLFPVLSFIFLAGKCRYCGKKISWQYPSVELAAGLLFAAAYLIETSHSISIRQLADQSSIDLNFILLLSRDWIVIASLIVIFVYDFKWLIIPDAIALPAAAAVIILNLLIGVSAASMLIGLAIGLGFFGLQYVVSKGTWIGGGDIRLGALMGVLLGWPIILIALFLSYIMGAAVSLILIWLKKATPKSPVPFGVFLAPATVIALFWGEKILSWYLG